MTDKPLDAVGMDFKPGTQQLGKHDFRMAGKPLDAIASPFQPSDFEVVHGDELAALRWVRANREAVRALVAGRAAVVPLNYHGMTLAGIDYGIQDEPAMCLAHLRLDIPASQEEP